MPARASPSGFAAPYHLSISPTCVVSLHMEYTQHPALKGLRILFSMRGFVIT